MTSVDRTVSVAPMLDWTDRHCRYFHRLISPHCLLYTEMVTTPAVLQGKQEKTLAYSSEEHPVALQLGGSNKKDLAECCVIAEQFGYSEVNVNVGCPSDRVQKGRFGACLMKEPELVASCVSAMRSATSLPITVKSRIGVDEQDSYEAFANFVEIVAQAGCDVFVVHARKAWLKGLSPKQNRTIPELKYEYVYQLKKEFPDLTIILNGGIDSVEAIEPHLTYVDGVMLGRAIWNEPWLLHEIDSYMGRQDSTKNRDTVLLAYQAYCDRMIAQGEKLHWMIKPILGLFHGFPGNKKWKSYLVNEAPGRPDDIAVITEARALVRY